MVKEDARSDVLTFSSLIAIDFIFELSQAFSRSVARQMYRIGYRFIIVTQCVIGLPRALCQRAGPTVLLDHTPVGVHVSRSHLLDPIFVAVSGAWIDSVFRRGNTFFRISSIQNTGLALVVASSQQSKVGHCAVAVHFLEDAHGCSAHPLRFAASPEPRAARCPFSAVWELDI
jgi:hypothetical protein